MDFAVCLCLSEQYLGHDIVKPVRILYDVFLQIISKQILSYRLHQDQRRAAQDASRSSALLSLRAIHRHTRRAIRRFEVASNLVRERRGRPECELEHHRRDGMCHATCPPAQQAEGRSRAIGHFRPTAEHHLSNRRLNRKLRYKQCPH